MACGEGDSSLGSVLRCVGRGQLWSPDGVLNLQKSCCCSDTAVGVVLPSVDVVDGGAAVGVFLQPVCAMASLAVAVVSDLISLIGTACIAAGT